MTAAESGSERVLNIRVEVDAGDLRLTWTDDPPASDGFESQVFATLSEAKAYALAEAIPERESWANCIRTIRAATLGDVL